MTCRGYDPKAVKISKSVKRLAAQILDNQLRSSFIRDYVRIEQANLRSGRKDSK
jgi:hypothetical protein